MGTFFSKPKIQAPPPPTPTPEDPAIEEARRKRRVAARRRKGRASTILTGGEGDPARIPTVVRKLLGGGA